jgi:thiamine biosynthesis lipoprotein
MSRIALAPSSQLLTIALLLTAIHHPAALERPLERFEFQEPHMGTAARVVLYASDAKSAESLAARAFARIGDLDARLSDYRESSELMKLSRRAGGSAVRVSADLFTVLERAQQISTRTGGAFDITIGPVTRLWRRARARGDTPDPERLAEAQRLVNYRDVQLVPARRQVRLLRRGIMLDLGGIAKGFAADQALETLTRHGARRALVALGGDIAVADPPPGSDGWQIAIAPFGDNEDAPRAPLVLRRSAVSTSGDAEQFLERDGVRYSHILTPATGSATSERRSVTVVARDGMTADSLATAVTVLGATKGLPIVDDTDGAAALVVEMTPSGRREHRSMRWP